jgi:hypothetical protein
MAVFSGELANPTTPAELRVLRAAMALVKAPRERPVSVAIHTGPVALVAVHDALHGDRGHALVPGEAIQRVEALEEWAAAQGWRVAASEAMARALQGQAVLGRRSRTAGGDVVVEITSLASA